MLDILLAVRKDQINPTFPSIKLIKKQLIKVVNVAALLSSFSEQHQLYKLLTGSYNPQGWV